MFYALKILFRSALLMGPLTLAFLSSVGFFFSQIEWLTQAQILTLIMALWMISWWIFEVLPMGITALIPLVYLPITGIVSLKSMSGAYSDPVIFLFLGGFALGHALEKTGLSERIALTVLKATGSSAGGILSGFIIATAGLSMWISNTATAVMMLPIARSIILFLSHDNKSDSDLKNLRISLYLSVAYSANIGGMMTPIGTPPNVVLLGFLSDIYNTSVPFWLWMLIACPIGIFLNLVQFGALRIMYPFSLKANHPFNDQLDARIKNLGTLNRAEKLCLFIFIVTCGLWVFKDLIHFLSQVNFLNDTSIAVFGCIALFLIPAFCKKKGIGPILKAESVSELPWNILLLFGGGMALAQALESQGLIQLSLEGFGSLGITNRFLIIALPAFITLILSEVMSNVALAVISLPLIMAIGVKYGIDPVVIALPAAIASSLGFCLPISTPPNAVVFSSQHLKVHQMIKTGIIMDIAGYAVLLVLIFVLMNTSIF